MHEWYLYREKIHIQTWLYDAETLYFSKRVECHEGQSQL